VIPSGHAHRTSSTLFLLNLAKGIAKLNLDRTSHSHAQAKADLQAGVDVIDRFRLNGRIALVTAGAGPLFGTSISRALAAAGATVITASRNLNRNVEFAHELRGVGWDAHGMQVDIQNTDSIDKLHHDVIDRFGRVDILVNNALARDSHSGVLSAQEPRHLADIAAGDFVGLVRICQQFLPTFISQGRGVILNIASIYGVVASDPAIYAGTDMCHPPTYSFVKGGMISFTRYLAAHYGHNGIRANCISPGGYYSDQPQAFVNAYSKRAPIRRMMNQEDIQGAVLYLASDASCYVTGANLMVDGGWTTI
jgi:NAD(P)-dependent dehydrogenase (short-subunit alcohol dehydrogenase family)